MRVRVKILQICARDGCGHASSKHLMIDSDNTDVAYWLDCVVVYAPQIQIVSVYS